MWGLISPGQRSNRSPCSARCTRPPRSKPHSPIAWADRSIVMKPRLLDAMGDALSLVRKSDLAGATALLRKALSGEPTEGSERDPQAQPQPPAPAYAPAARRPLGQTFRAL